MTWTVQHLEKLKEAGKIVDYQITSTKKLEPPARKPAKYRNKKTDVDGITFDSIKEADRYKFLKWRLKTGQIGHLEWQKAYELNPGGSHSLKYVADFVYIEASTGETIVEDVKGFRTREYKKKKRLMLKVHGITIKEV